MVGRASYFREGAARGPSADLVRQRPFKTAEALGERERSPKCLPSQSTGRGYLGPDTRRSRPGEWARYGVMQTGVCCCMGTPGLVRAAVARGWAEHGSRAPAGPSQGNGGAPAWRSDRVNWSGLWCGYTWAGQFGCACDEQGSGKPRAGGACRSNGHCVGVGAVHQPVQARGSEVHLRWSSIVGGRESDGATGKSVGDSCVQRARALQGAAGGGRVCSSGTGRACLAGVAGVCTEGKKSKS